LIPKLLKIDSTATVQINGNPFEHLSPDEYTETEKRVDARDYISPDELDERSNFLKKLAVDSLNSSDESDLEHSNAVIPREFANYSMPQMEDEEYPDPMLAKFIPDTAHEKFRYDRKVSSRKKLYSEKKSDLYYNILSRACGVAQENVSAEDPKENYIATLLI